MKPKLKASGLFYGIIFFAAALLNFGDDLVSDKLPLLSALTDFNYVLSLVIISALFILSAYIARLSFLQPVIFLVASPITIFTASDSFFGLGFFSVAILLLFKLDFYQRHRVAKAVGTIAYILAVEVAAALSKGERIYMSLTPTFFILAFIAFLFLTFRDRIVVYLKEPKIQLSLDEKGLSESEQIYVKAMVEGKNVKEISFDFGVSESTVRNTLSRAYKKLDITNKSGLARIAEKYEIVK